MKCNYSNMEFTEPRMNCAIDATMSLIEGRWKTVILCRLYREDRPLRFSELSSGIENISSRILSKHLKEMEKDGLIPRSGYPEVPVRVEYALTEKAHSLMPIMKMMAEWGLNNAFSNRVKFDDSILV